MAINFLRMMIDDGETDQATITEDFFTAVLFDGRINTDMTQCWKLHPSTTICTGGYGAKQFCGTQVQLHRLSWWLHNGLPEMTPCMVVRHKCDNPECTNPEHLEIGTHAQNNKEAYDRGLRVVPPKKEKVRHTACTECRAHTKNKCVYEGDDDCERCKSLGLTCIKEAAPLTSSAFVAGACSGESNKHCKVKDADIIAMRAERAGGAKVKDIAAKYGIAAAYAGSLINGKTGRKV